MGRMAPTPIPLRALPMSKKMLSVAKAITSQLNKKKKERQIWPVFLPKLSTMVPEKRQPMTIDKGVMAAKIKKNVIYFYIDASNVLNKLLIVDRNKYILITGLAV